ncbi:3-deoxy-7-phosphoheptulonate synthase [Fimicolochytrium jonesii]|uniref:3-deoxy-7-phosphoheptulonate synthase n=1 Tax=Fimicolochytrium jonesii TaxID=1396493 RepID=UPI0022FF2913|nr:3-deoxy-7-phosphoheptulonate synthase [Fimicolochytrium jonesii]KAI8818602.1 3-deoxy-7-phosphoheptulonate synthase [Fimicolochytrium jonesii]
MTNMAKERPALASTRRDSHALNDLDDRRIADIKPLIPPQLLFEDFPLSDSAAITVARGRMEAEECVKGESDKLLCVVGPCSIHDVKAAKEYGQLLKAYADTARDDLVIIMRVYFEKPRTTVGWKGLINDPTMTGDFAINKGLKLARGLLLHLNEIGIPTGSEFLDTLTPQYVGDLAAWGAIGARTTESQVHRELASGLSVPVGFKNGTDGNVSIALDAIRAASSGHHFLSVTKQGLSAIVATTGNDSCHVILRGGNDGPNYSADHIRKFRAQVEKAGLQPRFMIDCSHGNSQKDHKRQGEVARSVAEQLSSTGPDSTADNIIGVMIESHLKEGRQNIPADGPAKLEYGVSVTDACIAWDQTVQVLNTLRDGVQKRRRNRKESSAR